MLRILLGLPSFLLEIIDDLSTALIFPAVTGEKLRPVKQLGSHDSRILQNIFTIQTFLFDLKPHLINVTFNRQVSLTEFPVFKEMPSFSNNM